MVSHQPDLSALYEAVAAYREAFRPSDQLAKPYVIARVNVFAAEDRETTEAQRETAYGNRGPGVDNARAPVFEAPL